MKKLLSIVILVISTCHPQKNYIKVMHPKPPAPLREFRGMCIASIANINWPSRQDLTVEEQKKELLAHIKKAHELNLNVVVFQVRPAADALYKSSHEPWSEFLTGTMGKAPSPAYDPLEFAIKECHKRGIKLHAWINPFRTRFNRNRVEEATDKHISKKHPEWIIDYGSYLWIDPGIPEAQNYVLKIVDDIVTRYDIDGLYIDDYFYPYTSKTREGKELLFKDNKSYKKYGKGMKRSDWRRKNIDTFVKKLYKKVKENKNWVKVGISPFGVWHTKEAIIHKWGFSAYKRLFADSKKWLQNGWLDYLAPQLYWETLTEKNNYQKLLTWWNKQNTNNRILLAGNSLEKMNEHFSWEQKRNRSWSSEEIIEQLKLTKKTSGLSGNILWSAKPIINNTKNISNLLKKLYVQPALIPHYSWVSKKRPQAPSGRCDLVKKTIKLAWRPMTNTQYANWVVQRFDGTYWHTQIIPGQKKSHMITFNKKSAPQIISVTGMTRSGSLSYPLIFKKT